MLPRSQRNSTPSFKDIIKNGQFFHDQFFIFRILKKQGKSHFSVSVSKKIAKTAVLRNKIKRRVYSIIKKISNKLNNGFNVVIIVKLGIENVEYLKLYSDIERNFVKCGLLK